MVTERTTYTKEELEECKYFSLRLLTPLEYEGKSAEDYGTQYVNRCINEKCAYGKKPAGDVLVNRKFMKKWHMGSLRPDIFVSENVYNLIIESGLTGACFNHEVKDYKGRDMPVYKVMKILNELPPMSSETCINLSRNSIKYKECGHGDFYIRSNAKYEAEKLIDLFDFNISSEKFDVYKEPLLIISAKARKILIENNIIPERNNRGEILPVVVL